MLHVFQIQGEILFGVLLQMFLRRNVNPPKDRGTKSAGILNIEFVPWVYSLDGHVVFVKLVAL
jgi:hypothetical protein